MTRSIAVTALALLAWSARPATAQEPPPGPRQQLQQEVRQRIWRVAQLRIGLRDDQMRKLEAAVHQHDERRRALEQQARAQRVTLREELTASTPDEARVSAALDRISALHRERLAIQEAEQQVLAEFMTPSQRARFGALREQVRRRAVSLRQGRAAGGASRDPSRR